MRRELAALLCVSSRCEHDLAAENAALGVDLVDGDHDAVAEIRSRHRAGAGQLQDGWDVDGRLRNDWTGEAKACSNYRGQ